MSVLNAPVLGGTVYGTTGADTITGSAYADQLFGMGGDDVINAGDGNDVIYGDGVITLAQVISTIGSFAVSNLTSGSDSDKDKKEKEKENEGNCGNDGKDNANHPSIAFLGNTADAKTVWQLHNTSNSAIVVTLQGIADFKCSTGHVAVKPITYTIPAHCDLIVASPSSQAHE